MNYRQRLGHWGETAAAKYLEEHGFTIVERNVRTPYGEIDLIAQQGELIVFVEVKTRASESFGPPEISITPRKLEHLLNSAQFYIQEHPDWDGAWRIDAIAILRKGKDSQPTIMVFENVCQG